jgi:DNA-binding transcriptional LysR family regulator
MSCSSSTRCAAGSSTRARSRTATCASPRHWRSAPIGWRRGSEEFVELYPEVKAAAAAVGRRTRRRHARSRRGAAVARADAARPDPPPAVHRPFSRLRLDRLPQEERPAAHDRGPRQHRLVAFGAPTATHFLYDLNSLLTVGRDPKQRRASPHISINNLAAIIRAVEHGVGIAVLPDYCVQPNSGLVRLLPQVDMPEMDCFLVYAEETEERRPRFRRSAISWSSKAQRWRY